MPQAIRFHKTGGPEVLELERVEVGEPGPGQARVRHTYIAVNFIDIYFRTGRYPLPLPNGLGSDAVGVVEAVGEGVTDIRVGQRVGYLLGPQGAYSDVRLMPADVLIPLPDGVSDRTAATLMMKGMTAQYLFRQVFPLKGGETILYHAAAGGVGLIACQWARAMGVTMIGTVSTDEKADIARANGCTHTIVTSRENIAQRVREITDGKGVPVVFDSVGKDTLEASLDSLQPRGSLVSNGTIARDTPETPEPCRTRSWYPSSWSGRVVSTAVRFSRAANVGSAPANTITPSGSGDGMSGRGGHSATSTVAPKR